MSTSALIAPAAQDEIATLFVGFELGKATWLIGLYSPQLGKTISRYKLDGGDINAARDQLGGCPDTPERHPACRRREARPGFRMERENLCLVTPMT
jgi:hypothetical protein